MNKDFVNKLSPQAQKWWLDICAREDEQRRHEDETILKEIQELQPAQLRNMIVAANRVIKHLLVREAELETIVKTIQRNA